MKHANADQSAFHGHDFEAAGLPLRVVHRDAFA
jgi:hypothetical protein